MTEIESAIAETVARMLTGQEKPSVRLLMSSGPDGVMTRMHVTIEFAPARELGEACSVVAIPR
jgi:hypothetical protein